MGGLFIVRDDDPALAAERLAAARAQFGRHGLGDLAEHRLPGWRLLHAGFVHGGPQGLLVDGDDLVAVAGTLMFDGLMGAPALRALLRETTLPEPDWTRLRGQFAAVVRRGGRSFLIGDRFGAFQVYQDAGRRLFSTSFLAAATALPRLGWDAQAVYEYAFNVFPIGDDSLFAELKRLGPGMVLELAPEGAVAHHVARPLPEAAVAMPLPERIARHRALLSGLVAAHVAQFGDAIMCPLSGGLDSRLVLAALRAAGARPRVYVYGPAGSPDVRIAQAIGAAEDFQVEWIEKDAHRAIAPDAFPEQVAANFHRFDAVPTYGGIFDNGGNAAAQDARHAGGALAISGGCGEIYRNFFYLADRPHSAAEIARSFYARYALGDVTPEFDERRFLRAIEDKILAGLERDGDRAPLPRAVVEQVYPRVRCRALFGREISIEGRLGPYAMPFLDQRLVEEALTLPMALKDAGRFEAMLLAAIDPALAAQPSAYGHNFTAPPGRRHRLAEWSTRARPIWLRQRSYAIHRRLRPLADENGGLLAPEYMSRVIDLEMPAMRRFFRIDRIADSGLWRRLACLEYLAAQLGSRLG